MKLNRLELHKNRTEIGFVFVLNMWRCECVEVKKTGRFSYMEVRKTRRCS